MKGIQLTQTWGKWNMGALAIMAAIFVFSLPGATLGQGKDLYLAKGCIACHGPDGKQPIQPIYPKLAGQNADYTVAQLKAFKSQKRKSGQSVLMWGMAAALSEADMKSIADYLQGVK